MSDGLPTTIAPLRLAAKNVQLKGRVGLHEMRRLHELIVAHEGEVEIDLRFYRHGEYGIPCVAGTVAATLTALCQRCLRPMDVTIQKTLALELVPTVDAPGRLEGFEPYGLAEEQVRLSELVEDELILSLPFLPMHPPQGCTAAASDAEDGASARRDNPFAVLQQLKER